MNTDESIRPFRIEIPQADLDDLAERLARTRLPQPAPGDDWTYGVPNTFLRDAVERWRDGYDWRETEARLGAHDQFVTDIDGQRVHFLHVRSSEQGATPLLLAHSYPGTVLDFLEMIDPLVDPVAHGGRPEDAFDVVVPSMPGTGFSGPLVESGWTMKRVAQAYDALMRRLGYDAYGVHGSDGGAMIARELGLLDPEGFLGLHVLQLFSFPSGAPDEMADFGPKEYAALGHMQWFQSVGGYNAFNSSRPQTIGVALADSPVGQLAWNELFMSFGNGTSLVTTDQILAEVTLEWLTNTGAAFGRYHYEEAHAGAEPQVNHARTGVSVFADDFQTIRSLAARDNDRIEQFVEHPDGGHYAMLERPTEVVADLRAFFA